MINHRTTFLFSTIAVAAMIASVGINPALAAPKHRVKAVKIHKESDIDPVMIPIASPHENRIVRYTYSPDIIYRIYTYPNRHTHIELGDDEGLKENPVTGDSIQWRISGGPKNLYVKPVRDDIQTSLTLITNRRTYQFQLISSSRNKSLYQKVSFDYPDRMAEIRLMQEQTNARINAEQARLNAQVMSSSVHPDQLDFEYSIRGSADFKPLSAYTDGVFTYLRMPNTQDSPAVFMQDEDGSLSLINYRTKQNMIIVERVAKKLLLKLGKQEITVIYNGNKR